MWGFGGGGGGGNPWLQGLASRIGAARGGGQGGGGGGRPMFGLGGLFSQMGQGWGGGQSVGGGAAHGGGMPSWGQHMQTGAPGGSPNSMSFAPQGGASPEQKQWADQYSAAKNAGNQYNYDYNNAAGQQAGGGVQLRPEMGNQQNAYQWGWNGGNPGETQAPNTFRPSGPSERKGGQKLEDDDD